MRREAKAARESAKRRGQKTYSTGFPCRRGHDSVRYTTGGGCVQCERERYQADPQTRNTQAADWRRDNVERARQIENDYARRNPDKGREWAASYRAAQLRATPAWLTPEQLAEISAIYAAVGPGEHVDHIVPLRGRNVCGLHVPWNLEYLSGPENARKSNKVLT